jgi:hypothetical protein
MRRPLPQLAALALGVGAALLVACGASTKGGIPAASAGELKSQIGDVQQAVDSGRCDELDGQLRQVDDGVKGLPATVDARLRASLRDAADRLRREAVNECDAGAATTATTTEPVETQTEPPETTTAPTATQTVTVPETTTAPTTTAAPPVTTQPPPDEPPPAEPAPAPPPAPPATPGGGATPDYGDGDGTTP